MILTFKTYDRAKYFFNNPLKHNEKGLDTQMILKKYLACMDRFQESEITNLRASQNVLLLHNF